MHVRACLWRVLLEMGNSGDSEIFEGEISLIQVSPRPLANPPAHNPHKSPVAYFHLLEAHNRQQQQPAQSPSTRPEISHHHTLNQVTAETPPPGNQTLNKVTAETPTPGHHTLHQVTAETPTPGHCRDHYTRSPDTTPGHCRDHYTRSPHTTPGHCRDPSKHSTHK